MGYNQLASFKFPFVLHVEYEHVTRIPERTQTFKVYFCTVKIQKIYKHYKYGHS